MSRPSRWGRHDPRLPPRPRRPARRAAPGRRRRHRARRRPRGRGRGRPPPARRRRRPRPRRRGVEGERRRRRAHLRPVDADRPGRASRRASTAPTSTRPATSGGGSTRRSGACARAGIEGDAHRLRARAAVDEPLARRAATRATSPTRPCTRTSRRAVARRYGADVDRYILWNEPNLPSWLQPQASCVRRRCTPVAPHLYRGLVRAAYPAVKAADPGAEVLIGAMSSRGQELRARNSTLRPLLFLRALGCVSASYRKLRTGDCKGFKPARGGRLRVPPARHADLAGPRVSATATTSTSPRSAGSSRRSTASSAPAGCARARAASTSSSTSTATRRGRPTATPGSRSRRRTAGSSARPTARGATRACGCSPSTSGTTSRCGARAARSRAGSRACASSPAAPSPRSRTSTRRCRSTRRAAGCGARRGRVTRRR